jgi:hypothetical protein
MRRGLGTNVRVQGSAPCTEDEIRKEDFGLLGTPQDMQARISHARVYDASLETMLRKARDFVYKKGYSLKYWGVEDLLKTRSLAMTQVRYSVFPTLFQANLHVERLLATCTSWSRHLQDVCTRCTSRVRAWRLEGHISAPYPTSLCPWRRQCRE